MCSLGLELQECYRSQLTLEQVLPCWIHSWLFRSFGFGRALKNSILNLFKYQVKVNQLPCVKLALRQQGVRIHRTLFLINRALALRVLLVPFALVLSEDLWLKRKLKPKILNTEEGNHRHDYARWNQNQQIVWVLIRLTCLIISF